MARSERERERERENYTTFMLQHLVPCLCTDEMMNFVAYANIQYCKCEEKHRLHVLTVVVNNRIVFPVARGWRKQRRKVIQLHLRTAAPHFVFDSRKTVAELLYSCVEMLISLGQTCTTPRKTSTRILQAVISEAEQSIGGMNSERASSSFAVYLFSSFKDLSPHVLFFLI